MTKTSRLNYALLATVAVAGLLPIHPASAQTDTRLQSIEQQIQALKTQLGQVRAKVAARDQALKAAQQQAQTAQDQANAAAAQAASIATAAQAASIATAPPVAAPAPTAPAQPPLGQGQIRVGGLTVTLGGFAAMEGFDRPRNEATGILTAFNSIPFANSPNYRTPEFRMLSEASRASALTEGWIDDHQKLTAYAELDFFSAGTSSNSNQSNSYTIRPRQVWGAYENTDWGLHVVAGQTWSLATMYRIGLIPRQEDVPLTIDAQYVVGFDFARQAALRVTKDFDDHKLWAGLALEEPQTLFSPTAGPNCTTGANAAAYANGAIPESTTCGGSNVNSLTAYSNNNAPDIIAKLAADPGWGHYEVYGLLRFLDANQALATGVGSTHSQVTTGEGIGAGMILPLVSKKLEFQASGLYGKAVGRYGTSQLPDATFNPDGKLEPLTEYSVMGGFVAHPIPTLDIYAYGGAEGADQKSYGGTYGYGAPDANLSGCYQTLGTCNAVTSAIVEGTVGAWYRPIRSAYGTVQVGLQYVYVERNAFQGVGATPGSKLSPSTNENGLFFSFRYYPFQ